VDGVAHEDKEGERKAIEEFWDKNAKEKNIEGDFDDEFKRFVEGFVDERVREKEKGPGWCEDNFDMGEFVEAVSRLKEGKEFKACGMDGIVNWMIVRGGGGLWRGLLDLYNMAWEWEVKPESSKNRIKFIYIYIREKETERILTSIGR
jgi:hypothetical protein